MHFVLSGSIVSNRYSTFEKHTNSCVPVLFPTVMRPYQFPPWWVTTSRPRTGPITGRGPLLQLPRILLHLGCSTGCQRIHKMNQTWVMVIANQIKKLMSYKASKSKRYGPYWPSCWSMWEPVIHGLLGLWKKMAAKRALQAGKRCQSPQKPETRWEATHELSKLSCTLTMLFSPCSENTNRHEVPFPSISIQASDSIHITNFWLNHSTQSPQQRLPFGTTSRVKCSSSDHWDHWGYSSTSGTVPGASHFIHLG